jgi:serine/threonine protein kinase/tetratricopeptide (TPR) repeat protein
MPNLRAWQEISPHVDEMLSLSEEERTQWLAGVRTQMPEMGALLQSFREEHRLVEQTGFLEESTATLITEAEFRDQTVGPYRLLSKIGQGGMGSVWLAERTDGEIELKVAIKFLSKDSLRPVWRERFRTERQLLASLSHPSIVRVLDAGRMPDGRPYLIMEFVDGVPIDVHCADIPIRSRLQLFLQVCAGISYAHRRSIIHRDLKPSNILVDESGQPKLLDFGIARLLDETSDSSFTAERLLTPQYASPEQLHGAPQTTATDIYSLGAVLYKLLTGRSPNDDADDAVPTPPSRFNPNVSFDLDCVLTKALRTAPEDRYASVEAFAGDVQAVLEMRSVRARSGNAWYRAHKFLRRSWIPVTAAALLAAGLSTGLSIASRERSMERKRSQQVRELTHVFVVDLQDELAKLEGSTKLRELTVRRGIEYLDNLSQSAGGDLELQKEVAAAYLKIGDAQGFPTKPNLGHIQDALTSYAKAGALYHRIAVRNPAYVPDLAQFYLQNARLVRFHNLRHAKTLAELAIQTFSGFLPPVNGRLREGYVGGWCTLGDIEEDLAHYRAAWTDFQHCRALAQDWEKTTGERAALSSVAQAEERIATAARELGLLTEALKALDEDQAIVDQLLALEPRNPSLQRRRALVDHYRAEIYFNDEDANFGRPAAALRSAKQYLARAEQMSLNDPNDTAAQFSHAIALFQVSLCVRGADPSTAVTSASASLRIFDSFIASGKTGYLIESRRFRALERLGQAQLAAGRTRAALITAESALAAGRAVAVTYDASVQERTSLVGVLLLNAQANAQARDFEKAELLFWQAQEEARMLAKDSELESIIPAAGVEAALGNFYLRLKRSDQARACFKRLINLWEQVPRTNGYVDRQKAIAKRCLASA